MKCPRCKREISYEAMTCKCGWSATVSGPAAPKRMLQKLPPVNPEMRAKIDELLKKFRQKAGEKIERAPRKEYMHEVTAGHGSVCCCELCWVKRMPRRKPKEDEDAEGKSG